MFSEKELLARSEIMIWFKLVWFMKLDSLTKATTCDSCSEVTEGSKIGGGRGKKDGLSLFLSFFLFQQNGGGGHCVLKWGFMQTFPGNQDATLK